MLDAFGVDDFVRSIVGIAPLLELMLQAVVDDLVGRSGYVCFSRGDSDGAVFVMNIVVLGDVDLLFIGDYEREYVVLGCGVANIGERAG